jgi:hypothetical protein
MDNFDLKKYLVENKVTIQSRLNEAFNPFLDTKEGGYMREYIDDIVEDSAGTFELKKDWTGKDIKGKRVTLKKGTRLKHERSGGFGQDYMKAGSIMIDADEIGQDYLSAPY